MIGSARRFAGALRYRPATLLALALLAIVVVSALAAAIVAPHDPILQHRDAFLAPPFWLADGRPEFLLGTDAAGRDVLSRILYGARVSLVFGAIVTLLAGAVGGAAGVASAVWQGWVGGVLERLVDIVQTLPVLVLALAVIAILGPGQVPAIIALSIALLPGFARIARAATLAQLGKEYALASRALGGASFHLIRWVVLPNIGGPLVVQGTLALSEAILGLAALGFLGLGLTPPTPEWGTMLADGRPYVLNAWWTVVVPGGAILVTVLSLNLAADGLREALDPKAPIATGPNT